MVVDGAVNVPAEKRGESQDLGLVTHELLVGAAGQIQLDPAILKLGQRLVGMRDEHLSRRHFLRAEGVAARCDPPHEEFVVAVLICQRVLGRAAACANLLGQADHLVNRLFAVELHHEIAGQCRQLGGRLARAGGRQLLNHHGNHHVGPAFADEAQRSVEIEQGKPRGGTQAQFANDFDIRPRQKPRRARFGDATLVIPFMRN